MLFKKRTHDGGGNNPNRNYGQADGEMLGISLNNVPHQTKVLLTTR
jgi:hypothetical protein